MPSRFLIVTDHQDDHFDSRCFSALTALDLDHQTRGQQSNVISQIQESLDNISSQTGEEVDHLKMIGEEFAKLKQGQIVTV